MKRSKNRGVLLLRIFYHRLRDFGSGEIERMMTASRNAAPVNSTKLDVITFLFYYLLLCFFPFLPCIQSISAKYLPLILEKVTLVGKRFIPIAAIPTTLQAHSLSSSGRRKQTDSPSFKIVTDGVNF